MFRIFSNGFRLPSGEVKETSEVLSARDQLSATSTVKQVLELYISNKNMSSMLESEHLIGRTSYFLFKEYINKPVNQIPEAVLEQIIPDIRANSVPSLKGESPALRAKLVSLMNAQLLALQTSAPAAPRV